MKKILSLVMAIAMLCCFAFAEEIPVVEVNIEEVSYEGAYVVITENEDLCVALPVEWEVYETETGYVYGNDTMALTIVVAPMDMEALLETAVADEYTGFAIFVINGIEWITFTNADDTVNIAATYYDEGAVLVFEFDTAEAMGDDMLPVEIMSTLSAAKAAAVAE